MSIPSKLKILVVAGAVLAVGPVGQRAYAAWPVTIVANAPEEFHAIERRIHWAKQIMEAINTVQSIKTQIEYADYQVAEQIGKVGDVVEFINKLSGPWSFKAQFMSESYNQFLRVKDEINKLKDWNISFSAETDFVSNRAPNRNPTLETMISRYKLVEDAFDAVNTTHLGNSDKVSRRMDESVDWKALSLYAKGAPIAQSKIQAMQLNAQIGAGSAAAGMYEVMTNQANYNLIRDKTATMEKLEAGAVSNDKGSEEAENEVKRAGAAAGTVADTIAGGLTRTNEVGAGSSTDLSAPSLSGVPVSAPNNNTWRK